MCLAGVLRNAAKATVTAQIGGVTAADVAAAAAAAAAQQQGSGKRGSAPPGVLLTAMPLAQRCYGQAGGESFRCPIEDVRKHHSDDADTANFRTPNSRFISAPSNCMRRHNEPPKRMLCQVHDPQELVTN